MKKLTLLLSALLISFLSFAQTTSSVPHIVYPGMSADKWLVIQPTNVQHIDNKFVESKQLKLTQANIYFRDFRFSLPVNVTIQGIDVRITRKKKGSNEVKDVTVTLLKPINATEATGKGPNLAKPDLWTETINTMLYAFPSTAIDGDGKTFQWTTAEINHPAFGLFFSISSGAGKGAAFLIDKVELTIKYTQGTNVYTQTQTGIEANAIQLKQLGSKFQVDVKQEGHYKFTVRTREGITVQQTTIHNGRRMMVPLDTKLKGYYIITVEGNNQVKSQQVLIQ